jgi:hypothetical protein
MANILGCAGSKPSVTLTVAGRRLLALVGKATPQVMMVQISILPLQQQLILKKLLVSSIPDIDNLVAAAGRADWNRSSMEREKARNVQQANSNPQNLHSNIPERVPQLPQEKTHGVPSQGKTPISLQGQALESPQNRSSGLIPPGVTHDIKPLETNINELKIETKIYDQDVTDFPSIALSMFPNNRSPLDNNTPLNEYGTPPDTPPTPPGRYSLSGSPKLTGSSPFLTGAPNGVSPKGTTLSPYKDNQITNGNVPYDSSLKVMTNFHDPSIAFSPSVSTRTTPSPMTPSQVSTKHTEVTLFPLLFCISIFYT